MIRLLHSLFAFFLTVSTLAQPVGLPAPLITLEVKTERPSARYAVGEEVTFEITGIRTLPGKKAVTEPAAELQVSCVLSKDGHNPRPMEMVKLSADGTAKITGTLDEPGFLQLRVTGGASPALASAAFEPEKIKPSMPVPDDFDAFWTAQKNTLKQIPLRSTLVPVTSPVEGVNVFDVKVDCLGAPVSGYFGKPAQAKPKALPAILFVHGAGVVSSFIGSMQWASRQEGMLAMDINAHGIENGQPKEFYQNLAATALKDYRYVGRDDREKCYFRAMFLRLVRAIDFLTSQPEWDGKTLIVYGSSQGGYQAIAAAGLDHRVSFICAGVPAGCDHTGFAINRISGWPKLVAMDPMGQPVPASVEAARYFDCVNFATRAKCKGAVFTVGFIDTACPPSSVYAAYNALTIPKAIHADPLVGHTNSPQASKFMQEAALKHARRE